MAKRLFAAFGGFDDGLIDLALVLALGLMNQKRGILILRHGGAIILGFLTGVKKLDDFIASLNENLPLAILFAF